MTPEEQAEFNYLRALLNEHGQRIALLQQQIADLYKFIREIRDNQ